MTFRTHDDRRPSKFIVLADNIRPAIKMAWEHGGADFQSRFDKSTAQAELLLVTLKLLRGFVHQPPGLLGLPRHQLIGYDGRDELSCDLGPGSPRD